MINFGKDMEHPSKNEKDVGGRPTTFNSKVADKICAYIIQGKRIREISDMKDMPAMSTIFKWLSENERFSEQYSLSKTLQADVMEDELLDIADNGTNDWMEDNYDKGKTPGYALNGENIQRSRLRVDTRKWLMSKMKPKKYGDKMDVTTDGKAIESNTIILKDFSGTETDSK